MITAFITVIACFLCFCAGWVLCPPKPAKWEKVKVDPTGKGPNVDPFHYRINTDEGLHDFTDHEKGRGKTRATSTYDYLM